MSIALVQRCGNGSRTSSSSSFTFSPAANTTAGNKVILAVGAGTTASVTSVTDTQSNTWSVVAGGALAGKISICSADLTHALTTSDTITVNLAASATPNYAIYEYSGLATGAADQTATASTSGSQSSLTAGPTGTTTQASELAVTATRVNKTESSVTVSTGWTIEDSGESGVVFAAMQFADQILSATGTVSATWTYSTAGNGVAAIATFPAAIPSASATAPSALIAVRAPAPSLSLGPTATSPSAQIRVQASVPTLAAGLVAIPALSQVRARTYAIGAVTVTANLQPGPAQARLRGSRVSAGLFATAQTGQIRLRTQKPTLVASVTITSPHASVRLVCGQITTAFQGLVLLPPRIRTPTFAQPQKYTSSLGVAQSYSSVATVLP